MPFDASDTPRRCFVVTWADNATLRADMCCEEAEELCLMSVLFINMEESGRYCVSFYRPEIDFILPLCSSACLTCSLRAEQRCYKCAVISKGDHFVHFSSRESKEAATDRKQLFIRTDSLNVAGAVSTMSRTTGPYLSLSYSEKHPRFQHRQGDYCSPVCCPVQTWKYQSEPVGRPFIYL